MIYGFNLLESTGLTFVSAVALTMALSDSEVQTDNQQMKGLIRELSSFVRASQGEAITQNKRLLLEKTEDGQSIVMTSQDDGALIRTFSLAPYQRLKLEFNYAGGSLALLGSSGKLSNGHIAFFPHNTPDRRVKLVTSLGAGRILVCSVQGADYELRQC